MANLQFGPEAPFLLRFAADAALVTHIMGGAVSLVAGTVAILAPKGETLHRAAGNVFFVAMLAMAGVGAVVGPLLPEFGTGLAGMYTFYLVATAWATVLRPEGRSGRFEGIAFVYAVIAVVLALVIALVAETSPKGAVDGLPSTFFYSVAALIAMSAAFDLRLIRRGGISGAPRIARHVWRMCLALFIAMGSYFLGQPKFVPEILKETNLNLVPPLMVVVLLFYWLIRVRFTRWYSSASEPAAPLSPAVTLRASDGDRR